MEVKEHYESHLENFYSWMIGDFNAKQNEQREYFVKNGIKPLQTRVAVDLGAGNGLQSIPLANQGFLVTGIDFNTKLLTELKANDRSQFITTINDDIRNVKRYKSLKPELINCGGDTILHLSNKTEISQLLKDCYETLIPKGKLILSFRDYSIPLVGDQRFIPVRSDENRILTCLLEFTDTQVFVTDLLNTKIDNVWHQQVSSYCKTRITPFEILNILRKNRFEILGHETIGRMDYIIANKS